MHFFGPPLFYGPFRRARQGVVPGRGGPGGSSWDRSPKGWRCTRCPRGRAWRPRWPHTACGPSPRAIRGTSASRARSQGCTSWSGVRGEVVVVLATGYTAHTADREVIEAAVRKASHDYSSARLSLGRIVPVWRRLCPNLVSPYL